ncbi:NUDIX domain-containing protein [Luteimonas kalidii]|uniref:NUDIX domain-containing protein n=1 Tax=Luteimonas kalidii TaxID=3042025 RepID=A0ABT6JXG3_9GAMM|nr:NUDIX domain-containing protein [Luteimonas kalidii]MDH5835390.1 NUDIX domain-containing protein [Luteimonas kalidii]
MRHDCVGALLVRDARVLLGRRAPDAAWLADAWDIFGGHLEPGETPEAALRRELREELGIDAGALQPLGELCGDQPEPWRLRAFGLHAWRGTPVAHAAGGHVGMRWCGLEEARALLLPAHAGFDALLAAALAMGGGPRAASIADEPDPEPGTPR